MSEVSMATQKRIIIWSVSRSLSTALMRALSQLPDSLAIIEYLIAAGFNEAPDVFDEHKDDLSVESGFTFQSWKEMYEQPYRRKAFIIGKEMADHLGGRMEMIPEGYTHAFLMRHPSKSITSHDTALSCLSPEQKSFVLKFNQFQGLASVHEYVTQTLGQKTAAVLDADDLLAKPAEALRLFCEAIGLPFSVKLLQWDRVVGEIPFNWLLPKIMAGNCIEAGVFKNAFESTCFHSNKERSGAAKETDKIKPEIKEMIQKALPYYESLYKHRLIVK